MALIIVCDVHSEGKAVGYVEQDAADALPLWGSREDGEWRLYAGTSDEFRASHRRFPLALKALARELELVGTIRYTYEYKSDHEYVMEVK